MGSQGDAALTLDTAGSIRRLLWWFVVTTVAVFSISASKEDLYILPAIPVAAVLVADLLVEDGLAMYQDNPRHRRAKLLIPTKRGLEVILAINTRQQAWADALGSRIGEAELARASTILDRLTRAMRDERSSDAASSPQPSHRRAPRTR